MGLNGIEARDPTGPVEGTVLSSHPWVSGDGAPQIFRDEDEDHESPTSNPMGSLDMSYALKSSPF